MTTTREIQRRLIALGYDVGPAGADGIPGRTTTKAIARFQGEEYSGAVSRHCLAEDPQGARVE